MSLDLGRHLGWLFRRPLARWLDETPESIDEDLRNATTTWEDLGVGHIVRALTWALTAGVCFVAGIVSITVEELMAGHSNQPSGAIQVAFGIAMLTGILHGGAAVLAGRGGRLSERSRPRGRKARRTDPGPEGPTGVRLWLLRPGNRYFLIAAAFFAVGVVSLST
ncbi:hypothetical protein GCM10009827_114770 [Dactylosporangium maewongense]|uniref:Integral membrane protein n=1 Tax=Dactylosporangium maewongense TaxID=634393 RepID=A0ABP4PAE7_9ACTN